MVSFSENSDDLERILAQLQEMLVALKDDREFKNVCFLLEMAQLETCKIAATKSVCRK